MVLPLRIAIFAAIVIYFIILSYLLKHKSLNLKYTLLWIFAGVVMMIIATFPDLFITLIKSIGIKDTNIGILAIILFLVLVLLMSLTSIVSKLNEKNKILVQKVALIEKRVRELENR